ncbi:MAG: hypothetical protein PVH31_05390 [Ectothiorhodospiraceae bacterium]|jgi:hypothetical protein
MADQKANSVEQKARRFDARLSMQSLSLTGMDWRLEQPVAPAGRRVVRAPRRLIRRLRVTVERFWMVAEWLRHQVWGPEIRGSRSA